MCCTYEIFLLLWVVCCLRYFIIVADWLCSCVCRLSAVGCRSPKAVNGSVDEYVFVPKTRPPDHLSDCGTRYLTVLLLANFLAFTVLSCCTLFDYHYLLLSRVAITAVGPFGTKTFAKTLKKN